MPTACVTGATGYVATELIKQLLAKGYAVKATVRGDPQSPRLQRLAADVTAAAAAAAAPGGGGSCGNLQLVQVPDIEAPSEALDSALAGAEILFHVASPFRFDGARVHFVQRSGEAHTVWCRAAALLQGLVACVWPRTPAANRRNRLVVGCDSLALQCMCSHLASHMPPHTHTYPHPHQATP
jgi:NAD(P)-dependent dehydrogenase (short-subunit alcohol dehydrogenase family)